MAIRLLAEVFVNFLEKRPNSGVPDRFLSRDLILCVGEDSRELMRSAKQGLSDLSPKHHHYRCFHFWKYDRPDLTLALTGIGTGCLEPLIWELVESKKVERIVLIGTAGYIGSRQDRHGKVYVIDDAYFAGTGVHVRHIADPVHPQFSNLSLCRLERLAGIASDYYYGVAKSDDARIIAMQQSDPVLNEAMSTVRKDDRLVDMETPQFYKLCEVYGAGLLEYVAIRGVANTQGSWGEQSKFSESVLTEALRQAKLLLAATRFD